MNAKIVVALAIALAAVGQIVMKKGLSLIPVTNLSVTNLAPFLYRVVKSPTIITGFLLYGVSSILWLFALSKVELSLAYPMLAGSYVIVAIISYYLFGEHFTITRMVGLGIIATGVIVISQG